MNNGIEASREIPRFTCPKIFLNELYAPMSRQVVGSATAKIVHRNDLAAETAYRMVKRGPYKPRATVTWSRHFNWRVGGGTSVWAPPMDFGRVMKAFK